MVEEETKLKSGPKNEIYKKTCSIRFILPSFLLPYSVHGLYHLFTPFYHYTFSVALFIAKPFTRVTIRAASEVKRREWLMSLMLSSTTIIIILNF